MYDKLSGYLNTRITIAGMALVILGLFIPVIGWFIILPIGLVAIIAGLIGKEEVKAVEKLRPKEDVILDADLVTSQIKAISKKILELRQILTNFESIDQYAACLKDAESKIQSAKNLEPSLIQIVGEVRSQINEAESTVNDLEKSKLVYGIQSESLEKKIAQERAKLETLRKDMEKYEKILFELRSKCDVLASLLHEELGPDETAETKALYLKVLARYKEKFGKDADKKLKRDLSVLTRQGVYRKVALEKLYGSFK